MKCAVHQNDIFVAFKVDRVRKSGDQYPTKRIEADRVNFRVFTNSVKGGFETEEELASKTHVLFFVPIVGRRDVSNRLRHKNDTPRHASAGGAIWLRPTKCQKPDSPRNAPFAPEASPR